MYNFLEVVTLILIPNNLFNNLFQFLKTHEVNTKELQSHLINFSCQNIKIISGYFFMQ